MNKSKKIAIIPAYNEEENIGKILMKMRKLIKNNVIDKILVIDDCSTDRTGEIANSMGADVVTHVINLGIGAAQRTGYRIAIESDYDYVMQLDADCQHDPSFIPRFISTLSDADMVIGSRFLNSSFDEYGFVRKMGIRFFSYILKKLSSTNVTDVTSGFRAYRAEKLRELSRIPDGHWAIEQTLEAGRKKFKIAEISTHMPVRRNGKSQFNLNTYAYYPFKMAGVIMKVLLFR